MSAQRRRALSDQALAAAIRAAEPLWPASPQLAPGVADRIRESERNPRLQTRLSLPSRRRTVIVLVAALLLLAAAAVAASLVVRIGAESVTVVPDTPSALPSSVLSPEVLGDPSSLGAVGAAAGFEPLVPRGLGEPDGVWIGSTPPDQSGAVGSWVIMAWSPTSKLPPLDDLPWGAVLIEFHGRADLAAKIVSAESGQIRGVNLAGGQGLWVTGEHSIVLAPAEEGEPITLRVTGNVLLWQRGDLTLRLETTLDLPSALSIARSAE